MNEETQKALQLVLSILTTILIPTATVLIRGMVAELVKKVDDRVTSFELAVTKTDGDRKAHEEVSEIRHAQNERRIAFMEDQWKAVQSRLDQQQQLLRNMDSPRTGHL